MGLPRLRTTYRTALSPAHEATIALDITTSKLACIRRYTVGDVPRGERRVTQVDTDTMIDALRASGPHPDLADRLVLFGQFVGAWDVDIVNYGHDGVRTEIQGEWHFGWALEGRAIMDVWIAPRRSLRGASPGGEYGVGVRIFDPSIDAWRSTWIGPARGVVKPFIARETGGEIVLEGRFADDRLERWIFSDIAATHFRWRYIASTDGGATWALVQEMAAHRVPSTEEYGAYEASTATEPAAR